ncbi:MAG: DUF4102 domain-containing protein [Alphaproteobacteria bacterium]|nr:DUF4102 domain-containing protein [Alphaproteobacteria bacterium]
MPLTEVKCKNAKPKEKTYKLYDARGLYLEVTPKAKKYWRFKYQINDKEKRLALGIYDQVSLAEAREARDAARKLLREHKDPSLEKKENKRKAALNSENCFEAIAKEWLENRKCSWTEGYTSYVLKRLEADIFPFVGAYPINQVTAAQILSALRKVEARGTKDLPHRLLQTCGQIFRYAIVTGRAEQDPAAALRGALKSAKKEHHAYLTAKEMPEFMKKLAEYDGDPLTKLALRLIILTFLRTTELRGAKWEEFDFEKAEWRIPAERMKMKETHIVPLAKQAVVILEQLKKLNEKSEFVFPARSNAFKCMSNNTMLFALYRMGYHSQTTVHGFRSTASTILNELGYRSDVIERQLSHGERNKIRAAYNHAQYLPERRTMMQGWADYLDEIMGGKVIIGYFGKTA